MALLSKNDSEAASLAPHDAASVRRSNRAAADYG
jgi:hypothetical protein